MGGSGIHEINNLRNLPYHRMRLFFALELAFALELVLAFELVRVVFSLCDWTARSTGFLVA